MPENIIYITRRERFNGAHRLFRADWSDEKNMEVFGKCSNPNWHGHNYIVFVTVKGPLNPETGYLVNLKDLSTIMHEYVVDPMDHKNLNLEVPFLKDQIISSETIAIAIWNQLEKPVREIGAQLHCVKLVETENNFVEYFGE